KPSNYPASASATSARTKFSKTIASLALAPEAPGQRGRSEEMNMHTIVNIGTNGPPKGIQLNWSNLLDNLRDLDRPHVIMGITDAHDIEEQADHIEAVLTLVASYVKAVVGDIGYHANRNIPDETGYLTDAMNEIVGSLRKKADAMLID